MKILLLCLLLATQVWSQKMPTTITGTSGNTYHLFQLHEPSYWEPEESISFSELENDLGDGYSSQVLYGASTGLRTWDLKLGSLASSAVLPITVTTPTGAAVSREEYLWELFCYTKVTGQPFVFTSPRDGQYYLVRFADKKLSYKKMRIQLYSTGVELKQVRIVGESVFQVDVAVPGLTSLYWWNELGHADPTWTANQGLNMTASGDVLFGPATQHNLPIVRINSVSTTGSLVMPTPPGDGEGPPPAPFENHFAEYIMVMKVREATFGQTSSVLVDDGLYSDTAVLVGTNGTTKFAPATTAGSPIAGTEYRLNGVLHESSDQQAPMNRYAIVHMRFTGAIPPIYEPQIGYHSKIDVAEVIYSTDLLSTNTTNLIYEYLIAKWAIN